MEEIKLFLFMDDLEFDVENIGEWKLRKRKMLLANSKRIVSGFQDLKLMSSCQLFYVPLLLSVF